MANYYLNSDGSLAKKKKKQTGNNYRLGNDGKLQITQEEEDIAPVKKEMPSAKKEEKRTWFTSGNFSDGYQFGDVTKTILGSGADIGQDFSKGLMGIGEGLQDAGAYLIGWNEKKRSEALDKLQGLSFLSESQKEKIGKSSKKAMQTSENMQKFIERDLVEESKISNMAANTGVFGGLLNLLNGEPEKNIDFEAMKNVDSIEKASVLGDKSDSLVQSAGQLVGTMGLQAVGVPWWVTTGTTSFGSGTEEAFQNDATYGEAGTYGLINAGADILTEKLSGGISFGGKTLDDVWLKPLTNKISNKTVQTLTKFGLDVTGEGGEEVLASFIQNIGKKLTYEDEKTLNEVLFSEEALDEYLESFIGGAVLGGGANAVRVTNSIKDGTNYDTGLTDAEEQTLEQKVNEATRELEAQGQQLTKKQKQNIENTIKSEIIRNRNIAPIEEQAIAPEAQAIAPTVDTNAQQITEEQAIQENEVAEEAYHLANPQVKQKYSKTVDISKLDVVEQNGGGKRDIQYWVDKIQQDGGVITDPIEVAITDNGKYKIYDGHHRLQAAQELGLKEIPVAFIQEGHYTNVPSEFLNEVSEQEVIEQPTNENQEIQGLESYSRDEIKTITNDYIQEKLEENGIYDVTIKGLDVHGSRGRGTAKASSDLDMVVEYEGDIREDDLFDILNENPMYIDGVQVDINPITANNTGTLADYMERSKVYDKEILSKQEKENAQNEIVAQVEEAIAPLQETIEKLTEQVQEKIEGITEQIQTIQENIAPTSQDIVEKQGQEAGKTLTDEDMLPIAEDTTPEVESETTTESKVESPFDSRDITEVGKRSVKAYQYENPEVRPYFQEEAQNMLHDLDNTVKGEKTVTQVYNPYTGLYENAEWTGTTRQTTEAIAYLRDNYKYSYAQIRKGLNDIIEDNGKENNAVAKRIEFMLDERLREGYTTSDGIPIPANEDYINFLKEKQVTEYNRERLETLAIDENVPEEVVEETTVNTEPDQTNALEQYEASLQDELSPTVNTDVFEDIDTSFMRESTIQRLDNYKKMYEQLNVEMDESTVQEIVNHEKLYDKLIAEKNQSLTDFNNAILDKTLDYNRLKNKNTKKANNILQQIANLENRRDNIQTGYDKRINTAQANHNRRMNNVQKEYNRKMDNIINRVENMKSKKFEQNERKATQKEIREQLFKDTGIVSESLDHAKNISKVMMHNTDPIRLQEMVFGKELGGKINEIVFQEVKHNTSEKIRFQNKERGEIEELGIKPRSKESAAVQKYGEKQYVDETGKATKYGDEELKAEFPKVEDQEKIKHAAKVIRGKYDTYIDMVNAEITKYGYDAIPKRQDYMRHFQELNDIFSRYGLPFNMQSAQANEIPVDINGLTADLKPGKNWFASALRRKGVKTTYDAITGIDGYIEGIGNLIYHTGDIQKLRGFEEYIRNIYGQEHGFDNLDNLSDAEKAIRMNKIQDNHLGNYAAWVREYTNNLAGKKAMVDRAVEDIFGRKIYSFLNEIKSQVGSNMTGLNIGSALTNPISMTQALAKTSKLATLKGYGDTIKNIFIQDNFIEQNDFLTNRFGSDILSPTAWQKMRNAGQIFMTGTDWFASNAITRSKFYELKAKGLSDADAHKQAGDFASRILGDRSQGATPTLYNSKMLGLATQFQLEVNNQLYSMFYDTISDAKQDAKTKGTLQAASRATFILGQLAAYQHIYNNFYESIAGRRPAFDILAILATAFGIGEDEDEEKTTGDRLFEATDMLVDSLPYVSIFTGGGRIPISEALPIKEVFSGKDEYGNDKSRLETLGEAIPYYLLPTGYSQFKKTTSGLKMYDEDLPIAGSYTDSGNLRFTAEDDPMSKLQAGIFGQWSSPNAKEYIDSEFKAIDKSNIEELVDLGFDSTEYKKYKEGLNEIKKMELEDGESRATYLFDYINKQDVSEEQKSIMIKHLMKEGEIEDLSNLNMTPKETIQYYESKSSISQQVAEYKNDKSLLTLDTDSEEYKEAVSSLSNDKKAKIIDTIKNTDLPDDQKAYLYGKYYSSDKTLEKVISSGVPFDDYLTYSKDSLSLETSEDKAEYLYNANMPEKTKTVIYETSVLTGFDNEKKYKDYKTVKAAGVDINSWLSYTKQEFKADKNSSGKSISGSRKNKVAKYINSLNLSIPQKAIMLRTEYPSEDKYNKQIINYVSNLSISYEEKVEIFENLDMTVKDGRVYWD